METPPNDTVPVRRTTRSALAEIPARLGALTVMDNYRDTPGMFNLICINFCFK